MMSQTTILKQKLAQSHSATKQWRSKALSLEEEIQALRQHLSNARKANHAGA